MVGGGARAAQRTARTQQEKGDGAVMASTKNSACWLAASAPLRWRPAGAGAFRIKVIKLQVYKIQSLQAEGSAPGIWRNRRGVRIGGTGTTEAIFCPGPQPPMSPRNQQSTY